MCGLSERPQAVNPRDRENPKTITKREQQNLRTEAEADLYETEGA